MAAKYQLITELYRRTGKAVTGNPQAWQNFLASACRNYGFGYTGFQAEGIEAELSF